MTALIIGGDDIEGIKKEIAFHGVKRTTHRGWAQDARC